jgi:hypothetical protein
MQQGGESPPAADRALRAHRLALTAQLSGLGFAFRAFALVLLPVVYDPWATVAAVGIRSGGNPWWQALLTAGAIIVVVNSVMAGVFAGLLWRTVAGSC